MQKNTTVAKVDLCFPSEEEQMTRTNIAIAGPPHHVSWGEARGNMRMLLGGVPQCNGKPHAFISGESWTQKQKKIWSDF